MEKGREFQKNIYFCFIDYAKAFDRVDHNKLWKILKEMGIPKSMQTVIDSHKIKRFLLLGRIAMANVDSLLKSRSITLPTKFFKVKAMVFPAVMYGCESWTIKKAEIMMV